MKNLTFLILILLSIVFISCKKKPNHSSRPVSKGEVLMVVVSDSLEYIIEYERVEKEAPFYPSPLMGDDLYSEFIDGHYRFFIVPNALETTTTFYIDPIENVLVDFPVFKGYYPIIDSLSGADLGRHHFSSVPLDSSQVDFVIPYYSNQWDGGGWRSAWNKIKNVNIVYEYRKKYPDSRVAFLCLKKSSGETKRYFFMSKYKP